MKQLDLFGGGKTMREKKQKTPPPPDMFGMTGSDDWGRHRSNIGDFKGPMLLETQDPRTEAEREADRMKAAQQQTKPLTE